jgi:hypothetical protein
MDVNSSLSHDLIDVNMRTKSSKLIAMTRWLLSLYKHNAADNLKVLCAPLSTIDSTYREEVGSKSRLVIIANLQVQVL